MHAGLVKGYSKRNQQLIWGGMLSTIDSPVLEGAVRAPSWSVPPVSRLKYSALQRQAWGGFGLSCVTLGVLYSFGVFLIFRCAKFVNISCTMFQEEALNSRACWKWGDITDPKLFCSYTLDPLGFCDIHVGTTGQFEHAWTLPHRRPPLLEEICLVPDLRSP